MSKSTVSQNELTPQQRQFLDGEVSRVDRVASWIGWHAMELTATTVPALVAVTVWPWCGVASGAVATGWVLHAARRARTQRRLAADHGIALATGNDTADGDGDEAGAVAAAGDGREVSA